MTKFLSLTVCLLAPVYLAAQAPQYTIQDLGTLPNLPSCSATALSQSGKVVGYCVAKAGQNLLFMPQATHVFLYTSGAMTDLNISSPTGAFPTAVNDSSVVVGGAISVNGATGSASPFIYQNGAIQSVPPQLETALPLGLNNAGQMTATTLQVSGKTLNFFINSHAFLETLSTGSPTELAAPVAGGSSAAFGINSSGVIAGASVAQNASVVSPLLWTNLTPQALPLLSGFQQAIAASVNDSGVAAGIAFDVNFMLLADPNATSHAVLFNNGAVTDLGVLPGDVSSMATGINNAGSVVGFSSSQPPDFTLVLAALIATPASKYHPFIYTGGKMYDLNSQLTNGTGWQLAFATGINNAGQIVGTGLVNGAQHGFLLTPVASAAAPSIGNIVGAAFSTPAVTSISPNGIFTIFGNQLAAAPAYLTSTDIVNNQLPTNLGGTCVESGATKWSLNYVSPGQVNVVAGQLPASGTVPVTVVTGCGTANEVSSQPVNVAVAAVAPEFLYFLENSNGQNPIATIEPNGAYVGTPGLIAGATFAPAKAGDVLTAFGVGWGPTSPAQTPGTLAAAAATLTSHYTLTLGGATVVTSYVGVSPTYAGLYQVDFTVPSGLAAGNQPLVLTVDGVSTSPTAYIAIED